MAIEIALGGAMQNLVVERDGDGSKEMRLSPIPTKPSSRSTALSRKSAGRMVFMTRPRSGTAACKWTRTI